MPRSALEQPSQVGRPRRYLAEGAIGFVAGAVGFPDSTTAPRTLAVSKWAAMRTGGLAPSTAGRGFESLLRPISACRRSAPDVCPCWVSMTATELTGRSWCCYSVETGEAGDRRPSPVGERRFGNSRPETKGGMSAVGIHLGNSEQVVAVRRDRASGSGARGAAFGVGAASSRLAPGRGQVP